MSHTESRPDFQANLSPSDQVCSGYESSGRPRWHNYEAVRWALELECPDLAPNARLILALLASYSGRDGGNIRPSLKTIVARTAIPERSAKRAIAELITRGLLIRVCKGGNGSAAVYRIALTVSETSNGDHRGPDWPTNANASTASGAMVARERCGREGITGQINPNQGPNQQPSRAIVAHQHKLNSTQDQKREAALLSRAAPDARGTRLPANWQPSADSAAFARGLGIDPAVVLPTFIDHWTAQSGQKGRKADWEATWRNWCRRDAERLGGRAQGRQATLLPLAGGRTADPNDPWGVEEWCRSIGATTITNPEHLKRGKWMHMGCIIDSVARTVAREAGFVPSWRGDWSPLLRWIEAGCQPAQHIYPAVKSRAEFLRSKGDPAIALNVFTTAVMQRRAA